MGWTIDKAKAPARKPTPNTEMFLSSVRAHREGRHATCKNYWASICTVCWEQVAGETEWDYPGKGR